MGTFIPAGPKWWVLLSGEWYAKPIAFWSIEKDQDAEEDRDQAVPWYLDSEQSLVRGEAWYQVVHGDREEADDAAATEAGLHEQRRKTLTAAKP